MPSPTPQHDQYLRNLRAMMQEAVKETQRFDRLWNQLNDQFNAKIKEENRLRLERNQPPHSAVSIAEQKANWLALNDAYGAGNWWRAKATYLAAVIQAELLMRAEGL